MSKYPDQFLPKIAYYMFKGRFDRFDFFMTRQECDHGPLTEQNKQRIEELHNQYVVEETRQIIETSMDLEFMQ